MTESGGDPLAIPPSPVKKRTCPIRHLFLFIGADPNTDWLAGSGIALDDKGFIRTGEQRAKPARDQPAGRLRHRRRHARGSVKRVAAAVGEGAQVVAALHAFLAQDRQRGGAGPDRRS